MTKVTNVNGSSRFASPSGYNTCSEYYVLDASSFISILFESFDGLFIIKTQSFSIFLLPFA